MDDQLSLKTNDRRISLKKNNNDKNKAKEFFTAFLKPMGLIACLYFFICSLDTMSTSFRLIGGRSASKFLKENEMLTNPLTGLMIGVLVTVIVQSSSTSTSIVVSMVASRIIDVEHAIPIVMGANIGTSITSALVSLGQVGNRDNFRRAFAGATVHDMFNCLTVAVLLPLEILTHFLDITTNAIVKGIISFDLNAKEPELLQALTKPLTKRIIELDKNVFKFNNQENNLTNNSESNITPLRVACFKQNTTNVYNCNYLFASFDWPEWCIGLVLLIISLLVLVTCLLFMVKILNSLFQGPVAKLLQKIVNSDLPGPFRHFTAFVTIILGCILTIIIQSSSVFMSTLTPLVGLGLVSIERVFPLTLGSNIGTTVTGILAALSASPSTLEYSLRIAFCHSLFNITGILIWYPIPYLRKVPLGIAKWLGNTTSKYRWFVLVYLLNVFLIIPLSIFGLSMTRTSIMLGILIPILLIIISIIIINIIQNKYPSLLPEQFKNWKFLPEALRSLEPYDRFISNYLMCCKCCVKTSTEINKDINNLDDELNNIKIDDFRSNVRIIDHNDAYYLTSF